ncbi:unnamed protein product [Dracunculus medinensis]|uniref:Large ribosomal subunit protein P2 n=1 Tax=Dracunculus medinensis TaxID=318479 RepID=A0A0N4UHU0_DRAME|nr:unnamed protein product [Dracunculus medinensis]
MKYLAAYLLAQIGGNKSPNAKDIEKILGSVGLDVDMQDANQIVNSLSNKAVDELIKSGLTKISSVTLGCTSRPAVDTVSNAATNDNAQPPPKESKKEEVKEESDDEDMGFGLFD